MIRINLLGAPKVFSGDQLLTIPRLQTRALLYVLAIYSGPVPRSRLTYLFWPDTPEHVASRHLTNSLNHLRRCLAEPQALLKQANGIMLNPANVWTDVHHFTQLVSTALHKNHPVPTEAIELYSGPFLEGISIPNSPEFDNWLAAERTRLENLFLSALRDHIQRASSNGRLESAVSYGERYLTVDSLSEETYRQLIYNYGKLGDRAAVQRTYERCLAQLQQELDVEPLPSTMDAYNEAFSQTEINPEPDRISHIQQHQDALQLPFVGRTHALAVLNRAYGHASEGNGKFVMVTGEPGIGKSRTLHEFLVPLQDRVCILWGHCAPAGGLPYQALVEAIRALGADHQPHVDLPILAEVARLMPEFHTMFRNVPLPEVADSAHSRMRLYDALVQLVASYAKADTPAVLVLEALHWADSALLDWMVYLAARLGHHRLLVIGTSVEKNTPRLRQLQAMLQHQGVLEQYHLDALSPAHVLQLLQSLDLPTESREGVASQLYRLSGGNPNYLWELLQTMRELNRPLDTIVQGDLTWLSRNLQLVIQKRVEQLMPLSAQILQAAAVCGQTFDYDLVMHVAGRSEDETIGALDDLLERQLLVESTGHYQFHHDIVRSVIYSNLTTGRRLLLHRRVGQFLEARFSYQTHWEQHPPAELSASATLAHHVPPALVAHHFREAGDVDRASEYLLTASRHAFGALAYGEAWQYAEQGLESLAELPESPARDRLEVQLLIALGTAITTVSGPAAPEAAQAFYKARNLLQRMGEVRELAHVLVGLAVYFFTLADLKTADDISARLASLAAGDPADASLVMSFTLRGLVSYFQGDLDNALQYFDDAYRQYDVDRHTHLSRRYGYDPALHCLTYSAAVHILCGRAETGLQLLNSALDFADRLGQPYLKNSTHYYMAICCHHLRQVDRARQLAEIVLANAQERAYPSQMVLGIMVRGWAHAMQGEPTTGIEEMQYAISTLDIAGVLIGRPLYLSMLAEGLIAAGRLTDARLTLSEALTVVQERGERFIQPEIERLYGDTLAAETPESQDAEHWYRRAIASAQAIGATTLKLRASLPYAHLMMQRGDRNKAATLLWSLLEEFHSGATSDDIEAARSLLASLRPDG